MPKIKSAGFTIIELIVVIAIVAVLATIVMSAVTIYIGKANDERIKADITQISKKLQAYYADNSDFPDTSYWPETSGGVYSFRAPHDKTNRFVVFSIEKLSNGKVWQQDATSAKGAFDSTPSNGVYTIGNAGSCSGSCAGCEGLEEGACYGDCEWHGGGYCQGSCTGCYNLSSDDNFWGCFEWWGAKKSSCCSYWSQCTWSGYYCTEVSTTCPSDQGSCGVDGVCPTGCSWYSTAGCSGKPCSGDGPDECAASCSGGCTWNP